MKKKAVICDIDNTIVKTLKTDNLQEFYNHIDEYWMNEWCVDMLNGLSNKYEILFLTARGAEWEPVTRQMLKTICDFKHKLYMRRRNDLRADWEVKKDWIEYLQDSYEFILAIDDNSLNCEMFHNMKIPTLKVL